MRRNSEAWGKSLSSEFFPRVPAMGSIPLDCRFLRLFTPLQSVLSVAPQTHICSRQRHHERSGVGSSAAVRSSGAALSLADPRSRRSIATATIKHQRQFAWQEKKPIYSLSPFSARTCIRRRLRGPPCGFQIGRRLPRMLRNRRRAESAIASSARARGSHQTSLKAPLIQGRMASFFAASRVSALLA